MFSPGPWEAYHEDRSSLVRCSGHHIARIIGPEGTKRREKKLANARLIAAAPTMFEALRALIRGLSEVGFDPELTPQFIKAVTALTDAISGPEAEGKAEALAESKSQANGDPA